MVKNIRVLLTEDEGRRLFRDQLPLRGTVQRQIPGPDGTSWSLVCLDTPFHYQAERSPGQFVGFEVRRVFIRSRWSGYEVGGVEPTSVFVLLALNDALFDVQVVEPKDFLFEAWAMCRNE